MNRPVDLTNCDREPIHIPGSIQPFGFLLGLQSDFKVCMASENVADYLGRDYTDVFQRPITEVFSKAAVDAIRARVDYLSGPDANERIFGVPLQDGGKPFDIAIHFSGVYLIIEAYRTPTPEDPNERWALLGLPLPLSIDNVVAGTSLGLLGFSPWLAAPVFGGMTAIMALVGLQLGRVASGLLRIRPDLLTGVTLVVMATVLGPRA